MWMLGTNQGLLQPRSARTQVLLTTEASLQLLLYCVCIFSNCLFQPGRLTNFSMLPAVCRPAHKRSRKAEPAQEVTFTELTPWGSLISKDESNNNRMTVVTLTWTVHVKFLPNTSNFTHFTKAQRDTLLQKNSS